MLTKSADARYVADLGPYKIIALIGRGGMGVVLEAYEESLDRTVALKILRPELTSDAGALARFTREAKAAAASVWIAAGDRHGVAVGDCWWQRVSSQPVARYDVLWAGDDVCFCRVAPLVAGLQPARGAVVSLWPTPGQRRAGRATTAVAFIEDADLGQIAWVAAPPRVDVPDEPRVDRSLALAARALRSLTVAVLIGRFLTVAARTLRSLTVAVLIRRFRAVAVLSGQRFEGGDVGLLEHVLGIETPGHAGVEPRGDVATQRGVVVHDQALQGIRVATLGQLNLQREFRLVHFRHTLERTPPLDPDRAG